MSNFAKDINVPTNDCISRQAAIDAVVSAMIDGADAELVEGVMELLPSAQPEPCVDTIDALNESIKHFDDMAEECRRNANIERNDYMDMRDDAAEYRQLSTWLNELRWLRERFQSQPERKTGRWKLLYDNIWICTNCEQTEQFGVNIESTSDYCPSCGADMRVTPNELP